MEPTLEEKVTKLETLLEGINAYYRKTIGTGHTHAAVYGVANTPGAALIVPYRQRNRCRFGNRLLFTITPRQLATTKADHTPVVWDNQALVQLFGETQKVLGEVREEMSRHQEEGKCLSRKTKDLIHALVESW